MRVIVDPDYDQVGFAEMVQNPYFVDKTMFLSRAFECMTQDNSDVCIARPDGFGKSVVAQMIASFFGPKDSSELFDGLAISQHPQYTEFLNTHHVIYMDLTADNADIGVCEHLETLDEDLCDLLTKTFPEVKAPTRPSVPRILERIFLKTGHRFVFVIDNWDHILRTGGLSDQEKGWYQSFFTGLLKDQAYAALTVMMGVLPVVPMTSGSGLNMFSNFTVTTAYKFATDFGFTNAEVDDLYARYLHRQGQAARISREDLDHWYGGYSTETGTQLYNPTSIVQALTRNELGHYWNGFGPFVDAYDLVPCSTDTVGDDSEKLVAGESVSSLLNERFVGKDHLTSRTHILSAFLAYGLLTLDPSKGSSFVRIPNEEVRTQWVSALT